jgi:hypothetical protein
MPDYPPKPCIRCRNPITTGADICWTCTNKQRAAAQAKYDAETEALIQGRLDRAMAFRLKRKPYLYNGGTRKQRAELEASESAKLSSTDSAP